MNGSHVKMRSCDFFQNFYDWYFIGIVVDWHEYFFVWGNGPRENTKYCEIFFHHILVIAIRVHFWCLLDEQTLNGHLHDIFEFLFNTHQRFSTAIFFLLRRQQFFFIFYVCSANQSIFPSKRGKYRFFYINLIYWVINSSVINTSSAISFCIFPWKRTWNTGCQKTHDFAKKNS